MRKIIFDCDPGVDDATALFLAFAAPDALRLLGVTAVAGNVGAELTARNACIVRQMAGREDVPVFAGCGRPLVRAPVEAGDFHGPSGLGPLPIVAPRKGPESAHAAAFLVETLRRAEPGQISVVVTGPCTNLALALAMAPEIAARIAEIVVMGGARQEGGNVTASAEFNFFADPHAAAAVLGCGAPVTVFGLDVTHQVRTHPDRIDALREADTAVTRAIADLFAFSSAIEVGTPDDPGAPLHDPCPIAYLLDPTLFALRPCAIAIETSGAVALGHSQVDFRRPRAHMNWAVWADAPRLFDLLLTKVRQL